MISRMVGTPVFSDRTEFSVSTATNSGQVELWMERKHTFQSVYPIRYNSIPRAIMEDLFDLFDLFEVQT
jgi:hypothetical protein